MSLTQKRETVLSALFSLMSNVSFSLQGGAGGFKTTSRRLKHWSDVSVSDRPALFMTCHGETPTYRAENLPAYQKLSVHVYVYLSTADANIVGDTDISLILDAFDTALSPGPGEQRQTLGGLVSHCRVDGDILRDPGDMDGEGIIIVPISVSLT